MFFVFHKKKSDFVFAGISFLLHYDHNFVQAPYEEISESTYEEMMKNCKPITSGHIISEEDYSQECVSGACPVK